MRVIRPTPTVTYFSEAFPRPEPPLDAGDVIQVLTPFETLGGEAYERGDCLEIVGRTDEAPHGLITTEGNLLVRGKNGRVTVWSNIEWVMWDGHLKRR